MYNPNIKDFPIIPNLLTFVAGPTISASSGNVTIGANLTVNNTIAINGLTLQLNNASVSAATSLIFTGVSDGLLKINGGTGGSGGDVIVYGPTHATKPSHIEFRSNGTTVGEELGVAGNWSLGKDISSIITTTGLFQVTSGGPTLSNLSGSLGSNKGITVGNSAVANQGYVAFVSSNTSTPGAVGPQISVGTGATSNHDLQIFEDSGGGIYFYNFGGTQLGGFAGSSGFQIGTSSGPILSNNSGNLSTNGSLFLTGSVNGTRIELANTDTGGHIYDLVSTGSSSGEGAGYFLLVDITDSNARRISVDPFGSIIVRTNTTFSAGVPIHPALTIVNPTVPLTPPTITQGSYSSVAKLLLVNDFLQLGSATDGPIIGKNGAFVLQVQDKVQISGGPILSSAGGGLVSDGGASGLFYPNGSGGASLDGSVGTKTLAVRSNGGVSNHIAVSSRDAAGSTSTANGPLIIRGLVTGAGAQDYGTGYTSSRISQGLFRIDFNIAFQDLPSVVITGFTNSVDSTVGEIFSGGLATDHVIIRMLDGGIAVDTEFSFIAIGQIA